MTEKMNLTNLLREEASGNLSISVEKAENGIIVNVSHNVYGVPDEPSTSVTKRFVYSGSASEIFDALDTNLGLGNFFTV